METVDRRTVNGERAPKEFDLSQLANIPRVYGAPRPHGKNVLVKQNAAETTYYGTRFEIPESARQSPNQGVVVSVGPEIVECKPGDLVTFGLMNAEPIEISHEIFQLVSIYDVKLIEEVTYALNA